MKKTLDFCKKHWFKLLVLFLILHLFALIKKQSNEIKGVDILNYEVRSDINKKMWHFDAELEYLENRVDNLQLTADGLLGDFMEIKSREKRKEIEQEGEVEDEHPIEAAFQDCMGKAQNSQNMHKCVEAAIEKWNLEIERYTNLLLGILWFDDQKEALKQAHSAWLKFFEIERKSIRHINGQRRGTIYWQIGHAEILEMAEERALRLKEDYEGLLGDKIYEEKLQNYEDSQKK